MMFNIWYVKNTLIGVQTRYTVNDNINNNCQIYICVHLKIISFYTSIFMYNVLPCLFVSVIAFVQISIFLQSEVFK